MKSGWSSSKWFLANGAVLLFGLGAMQSSILRVAPSQSHAAEALKRKDNVDDDERRSDHPDEAIRFRRLQMQDEKGFIPVDGLEKARQHVALMRRAQLERIKKGIAIESAGIRPDSWRWLGPGNVGGRIRAIAIHPTNTNNMWVGSVSGGIWWTDNAGAQSWGPVDDFMANLAVSSIVINPANTNIMYAGTGEVFATNINNPGGGFSPDGLQGAGVFRSTDSGVTWNQLINTNPGNTSACPPPANPATCTWLYVNRLAISPNGNTLLAATLNGIQRSVDGGANWNPTNAIGQNMWLDVDFHPTNSQQAIGSGNGNAGVSTDAGQTWTLANFNPAIGGRVEISYAPSTPTTVYALVNQNNGDLYRSTDCGTINPNTGLVQCNFNRVNTGTNFFIDPSPGSTSQGGYDNILWVNPQDATFVVVGGIDLWRSTNSGTTFTQISRWQCAPQSAHADHHMIVAHPGFNNNTNRTVFFGNDGGIYRTDNVATVSQATDCPQNSGWTNLNNNLGITQYYGAAAASNGVIVGGTQDNGTVRFLGNTGNWTTMYGGDGGFCAADPTDPNFFYGEYVYLQINRSTNGGASAARIDTCPANPGCAGSLTDANSSTTANFIAPFILDPIDPSTMLAGGVNLWRTSDVKAATVTWNNINGNMPATSRISAIAVSPINSGFILVGRNNGDIYLTFSGTANPPTWTKIDPPFPALPDRFVTRLVIDPTRSPASWIYATFGGFSGDNVYRSTDLGTTWTDITGTAATGLPNVPVRGLAYHPRNPNFLYVGTEVGLFTSEDAGATWEVPQNGPANVPVDELFWLRTGQDLYPSDLVAVTHGRGIYRASFGIYVDCNFVGVEQGTFTQPFRTIAAAINATTRYQTIWIRPCDYHETFTVPPINKRLEFRSLGGTVRIGTP